jgi:putative ABC transport system substrate-binding protein
LLTGLILAVLLTPPHPPAAAQDDLSHIGVLLSYDLAPYQETLQGFRQYLMEQGAKVNFLVYNLKGDAAQAAPAVKEIRSGGAKLLFTLGTLALDAACREGADIPMIASLVMNTADLRKRSHLTGVALEFPLETQLHWLRRFLPRSRHVGVIFNPRENKPKMEAAARLAQKMGLDLVGLEVQTPQDLPGAMDNLAKRADVLWGVPDSLVITPQTARELLLLSFRSGIPFIGLSATWVEAGALYALDRDYVDVGRQCGEMAWKVLQGSPAGAIPPATPRKMVYFVNLKTAAQMKLDLPEELVRGARQVF